MLGSSTMTAPKKTTAKKPSTKASARAPSRRPKPERTRSRLVEIGDDAMRKALLAELRRADWNLSAVSDALNLSGAGNVLRAIRRLDLVDEYDAAKSAGKIRPGARSDSE